MPPRSKGVPETRSPGQLPPGFSNLRHVLDEKATAGSMLNVVGLVKDFRRPMPTRGSDFKCEITLYDRSIEDEDGGILLSIFGPEQTLPIVSASDVILALKVKVQRYRSNPLSLIVHHSTDLHLYSADKIPRPPQSARVALLPPKKRVSREPSEQEHAYVSWLYHEINKESIPDSETFQYRAEQSVNIRDKFSLLKDISEGRFYDVLLRVVKEPYTVDVRTTLWATDYTENQAFYNFAWDGPGDPYGYTTTDGSAGAKWTGPYGKRTIQITCYEPHASFIRDEVRPGQWVFLRNVQIKHGRSGDNLEGFMREDRGSSFQSKINVELLDGNDGSELEPRFKEALQRWYDYEKSKKAQIKAAHSGKKGAGTTGTGAKRKVDDEGNEKPNSKQRRKIARHGADKKAEEDESKVFDSLELNQHVAAERHEGHMSLVTDILKPVYYDTKIDGEGHKLELPFVCAKYQTIVRATDFRPNRLEDFASGRKHVLFDQLSNFSGADSSGEEGGGEGESRMVWEWRFALQLEDASSKIHPPPRFWVVVDNADAQYLLNLDASDLHKDPDGLDALREKLFTLWGDLEEHKAKRLAQEENMASRKPGDKPPLEDDSDHEDGGASSFKPSNKPFVCCIQQYGVEVPESDARECNAREGRRWERVFGLFGVRITS